MKSIAFAGVLAAAGCTAHVDPGELELSAPPPAPGPVAVIPAQSPRSAGRPLPTQADGTPRCIADVLADARSAWADDIEFPHDVLPVLQPELSAELGDLDGDGDPEVVVVNEPLCGVTGNCPMRVYLWADGCPTLALDTFAAYVWPAEERSNGVRNIESWAKDGCAGLAGGWTAHRFDGTRYIDTDTVSCGCPDGEDFGVSEESSRPPQCPG